MAEAPTRTKSAVGGGKNKRKDWTNVLLLNNSGQETKFTYYYVNVHCVNDRVATQVTGCFNLKRFNNGFEQILVVEFHL